MKWNKASIEIEEGMQRLANFIKNYHGEQDWESLFCFCTSGFCLTLPTNLVFAWP
jgi:hypothetical protein